MYSMSLIKKIFYADDETEGAGLLIRLRLPWLLAGMLGGIIASLIVSRFENIISQNISLAFFVPIVIYMSDAVGEQTENIFVRNSAKKNVNFLKYMAKEFLVGLSLGLIIGIILAILAFLWLNSLHFALAVGLALVTTISVAPIIALLVPQLLLKENADPALGAGPFTTIIQQVVSLLIYFSISSIILTGF